MNYGASSNVQRSVSFEVRHTLAETRVGLEKLLQHFDNTELRKALFIIYGLEARIDLDAKDEHEEYLGAW